MKINCNVEYYEYKDRIRNLTAEAKGKVKSQKFFPVYLKDGKEEIFKPISKTKPLATPLFAYSEVFWSTVINTYFDSKAPVYRLAICNGYSEEVPKYHNYGVIVPSIVEEDEKLINLIEYFKENPDEAFDKENYTNYCMRLYDYTPVFNTNLICKNQELGEQLALQILISILKADQNYHYENVGFICKNGKVLRFAPPIDHEFSSMFIYMDNLESNHLLLEDFFKNLIIKQPQTTEEKIFAELYKQFPGINTNLELIVERYENVVEKFLEILDVFIYDLEHNPINLKDNNYLFPFNTDNYRAGIVQYKNNDIETAKRILDSLKQSTVDIEQISQQIHKEILTLAKLFKKNLMYRLDTKHQKHLILE